LSWNKYIAKYENCKYTSKLRLWVEFCNDFFCGEWYWYTSTKFKTIYKLKSFGWKSIQKICVLHFLNNKCIIHFFYKNHYIKKKEEILLVGLYYYYYYYWFGNVLRSTSMRPYGHWKNVHYIFYAHCFYLILFIQPLDQV